MSLRSRRQSLAQGGASNASGTLGQDIKESEPAISGRQTS